MKKIFFVPWVLVCVSLVYFAGGVSVSFGAGDPTASAPAKAETFTGKVDSVLVRDDDMNGKYQQMTIRDDDGKQTVFVIAPDATITGKDGNSTSLNWIKGNRVSVKYVTASNGYTKTIKSIQELQES